MQQEEADSDVIKQSDEEELHDRWQRRFTGGGYTSVAFNSDGTKIVSGSYDDTIDLWDVSSGEQLDCLKGHSSWVNSVAFSPDGTKIVSCSDDETIKIWDVLSGKELNSLEGHSKEVNSVSFSPDGTKIVSGSWDKTIRMWNIY